MLSEMKKILNDSKDIIYLGLYIHNNRKKPATLIYIEGLVNADMIDSHILKPLAQEDVLGKSHGADIIDRLTHGAVYHCAVKAKDTVQEAVADVLSGNAALVIGGEDQAVIFEVKGFQTRGITEPSAENIVKGAKDSFTETLRVNTASIRRRIQSAALHIEEIPVGTEVKTNVAVIYMDGRADEKLVQDALNRVKDIRIAAVKSPGNIEEQFSDHLYSIFPQTIYTERPDRLCANILEGKIGILIDGYPIAYIAPVVFNNLFQSGEDYSLNYIQSSVLRLLRYVCSFFSLILPGFYVGIVTFHHEMLPTDLIASIIKSKESVALTSLLEVAFMLIAFEVLLEAGIRLPKSIGQSVSIIGGLVIGDAAVNAKFISPSVVVVIAITGICGFIIPNHYLSNAFRLLRIALVFISGFLGLYGLSLALILIIYNLCSMTSMRIPFMATSYPRAKGVGVRDIFLRVPIHRNGSGKSK